MSSQVRKARDGLAMGAMLVASLGVLRAWAGDPAKLARALSAPIVEGRTLAGVHIGASEREVVTLLGVPDSVESSPARGGEPLKVAHYMARPPATMLRVVFRKGRVEAVVVVAFDPSRAAVVAGQARGVGLGSTLGAVRAAYGPGPAGRLWYPALGIAFNPADKDRPDDEVVYIVLVARPGLDDDLVEAYGRVGH